MHAPASTAIAERAARIDRELPQTQCGQCGYNGCMPYATAIAEGSAEINQCPPGGDRGIRRLATLLDRELLPMNPVNGVAKRIATIVRIDESRCIGCMKCIHACPVDAIVGANQLMHTVIAAHCTGCDLCLPPCPMDCILIEPALTPPTGEHEEREFADRSRERYLARGARLQRDAEAMEAARRRRRQSLNESLNAAQAANADGAAPAYDPVAAALARARAKKAASEPGQSA
ncbi:MAG: RnfABCDGE type electron transport complex subunit B [Pseudomonadota bacterium]|nr:RnfABCDGE type electron transport complex subunit B [Pseudomonadota bacterium]